MKYYVHNDVWQSYYNCISFYLMSVLIVYFINLFTCSIYESYRPKIKYINLFTIYLFIINIVMINIVMINIVMINIVMINIVMINIVIINIVTAYLCRHNKEEIFTTF